MINKIYKIINNKFSRFFKFIFFIRYIFAIFFVAIAIFLSIPQFFDYQKREEIIKNYLSRVYGLDIKNLENIRYKSLPSPRLEISNVITLFDANTELETKTLVIYPKLLSIYNYENFDLKKINLKDSFLDIDLKNINSLSKKILKLEKKISLENFNLSINDSNRKIINLEKINFLNYGYKKNIINGEIFGRKFKVNFKDYLKNINLKLLATGISAKVRILENKNNFPIRGEIQGKILKSKIKINFSYEDSFLKVNSLFFRDKKLSFDSKGNFKLFPYFNANLTSEINHLDKILIQNLEINKILDYKDFIERIDGENIIFFKSKRFNRNLIDNLEIKTNLSYGRLDMIKNLKIKKSKLQCKSYVNLLDEFPILSFNCSIDSNDKKELLETINIKYKKKDKIFNLHAEGKLNILNNKINFDKIKMDDYDAPNEDLKFFKEKFEKILFNEDFNSIFDLSKLRKFIIEIS